MPHPRHSITTAFMVVIVVLNGLQVLYHHTAGVRAQASDWVSHTQEVRAQLCETAMDLANVLIGERGYVITGQAGYLQRQDAGRIAYTQDLRQLTALTRDNATQQARLSVLERRATALILHADQVSFVREKEGFGPAAALIDGQGAEHYLMPIETTIAAMQQDEDRLLAVRLAVVRRDDRQEETAFLVAMVMISAVVAALYGVVVREEGRQARG